MEVLNANSSLLSNFEVLTLLRELEGDYLARTKEAGTVDAAAQLRDDISNLRTVELEAINYLSAGYQPAQNAKGISQLVKDLATFELNKSEKLQIVNLAPTEAVELYVIVDELEDRLGERMEDVFSAVRGSLVSPPIAAPLEDDISGFANEAVGYSEHQIFGDEDLWAPDVNAIEFLDAGEGAGVEGDLDVDDD